MLTSAVSFEKILLGPGPPQTTFCFHPKKKKWINKTFFNNRSLQYKWNPPPPILLSLIPIRIWFSYFILLLSICPVIKYICIYCIQHCLLCNSKPNQLRKFARFGIKSGRIFPLPFFFFSITKPATTSSFLKQTQNPNTLIDSYSSNGHGGSSCSRVAVSCFSSWW